MSEKKKRRTFVGFPVPGKVTKSKNPISFQRSRFVVPGKVKKSKWANSSQSGEKKNGTDTTKKQSLQVPQSDGTKKSKRKSLKSNFNPPNFTCKDPLHHLLSPPPSDMSKIKEQYSGGYKKKKENLNMNNSTILRNKVDKFGRLLDAEKCDMDHLRKLSWSGIPKKYRSSVWKLLVGYLPEIRSKRKSYLKDRRKQYADFVRKYCDQGVVKEDESNQGGSSNVSFYENFGVTESERKQVVQIRVDIPRTNATIFVFKAKCVRDALTRILRVFSMRRPACGYVQGMNEVLSLFFAIFVLEVIGTHDLNSVNEKDLPKISANLHQIEADSFWSFSLFIDAIQDHYTFAQPGIQRLLKNFQKLMVKVDKPLHDYMVGHGFEFLQLFFRWMHCLLIREIPMRLGIRLFDTYLAEFKDLENFQLYVCAAFLYTWRETLMKCEITEFVVFLQNLPTDEWDFSDIETLISQAFVLQTLYNKKK